MPLHTAKAVALPRQTCLSRPIIFLSVHALPSLLILRALSLNFPQIFQSSSGNNMVRIKTNTPGGVFPQALYRNWLLAASDSQLQSDEGDGAHICILLTLVAVAQRLPACPLSPTASRSLHLCTSGEMIHPRCVSCMFQMKSLFTSCPVSKN